MAKRLHAPAEVIADFGTWQTTKRGNVNPENQTNGVWSWLIQTEAWPHAAHKAAGTGKKNEPGWCFCRFGKSETRLPDGTVVYVGGEHEDFYDPDFYIYNDVIVMRPDGAVEIYGYPVDVFPPTDFHSATLVGDEVLLLGGLGYGHDRQPAVTRSFRLCLSDFSIHRVETLGDGPSWLNGHTAELDQSRRKVVCSGGRVIHGKTGRLVENLATWEFDLSNNGWSQLPGPTVHRWLLVREDDGYNELWGIGEVARASRRKRQHETTETYRQRFAGRGHVVDAALFDARFSPPFPHESAERAGFAEDDWRTKRILVDGVLVRIVEGMSEITVTVEGDLPADRLSALEQFGLETYSALEGVPYKAIHL